MQTVIHCHTCVFSQALAQILKIDRKAWSLGRVRGLCIEDILGNVLKDKPNIWILSVSRCSVLPKACRLFYFTTLTNKLSVISLLRIHGSFTASCVLTECGFGKFSLHFHMRGHEMTKN